MAYECPRCKYETDSKASFMKHIKSRKEICPPTHADVPLDDVIKQLEESKQFVCSQCNKKFKSKNGMENHKKSTCKKKEAVVPTAPPPSESFEDSLLILLTLKMFRDIYDRLLSIYDPESEEKERVSAGLMKKMIAFLADPTIEHHTYSSFADDVLNLSIDHVLQEVMADSSEEGKTRKKALLEILADT